MLIQGSGHGAFKNMDESQRRAERKICGVPCLWNGRAWWVLGGTGGRREGCPVWGDGRGSGRCLGGGGLCGCVQL
jgi:hypothetical protein